MAIKTKFVTDDGQMFDSEKEAKHHDKTFGLTIKHIWALLAGSPNALYIFPNEVTRQLSSKEVRKKLIEAINRLD